MDTSTHIVVGIGVGLLAQLDPVIAATEMSQTAGIISCIIGSNAPDSDYLYKLKGNSYYYKRHRGLSHSIFVLPLYAILLSCISLFFFPLELAIHLGLWTFLAVLLHVGTDLCNIHGTQLWRPFTPAWISFDAIPLFDPFITLSHIVGFSLVFFANSPPGVTFLWLYIVLTLYILGRIFVTNDIRHHLSSRYPQAVRVKLIPSISLVRWQFIVETEKVYLLGSFYTNKITVEKTIVKQSITEDVLAKTLEEEIIASFIYSSPFAIPLMVQRKSGVEIRWIDLRFRKKSFFPFQAISVLNEQNEQVSSYSGWFHTPKQMKQKVRELKRNSLDF